MEDNKVVNADAIIEDKGVGNPPEPQVTGDSTTTNTGDTATADTTPKFDEKAWQTEKEKYETQIKDLKSKADIFDMLDKDPDVVDFVTKKYRKGDEPKKADQIVTQEDLEAAQSDPAKLKELIEKVTEAKIGRLPEEVGKAREEVKTLLLENDIDTYSKQKGNEDFWELEEAGLIRPLVREYKVKNPNADEMSVIQEAHKHARVIVQTLSKRANAEATAKANGMIEEKRNASIDKGTGGQRAASSNQNKSLRDIGQEVAKELGLPW